MIIFLNLFRTNWLWISFATCLFAFYITVPSLKIIIIAFWFGLFFLLRFTKLEKKLTRKEQNIYYIAILIYPIIFSFTHWMIYKNVIPYSWFWLNRLEHISASFGVAIISLPLFIDISRKCNWWQELLLIIGLVSFVGNLNEFVEYYIRSSSALIDTRILAIAYTDTIYDMTMNIIGGLMGWLVLRSKAG
jgi:hypothetical protein